jgi:hypothetical protein
MECKYRMCGNLRQHLMYRRLGIIFLEHSVLFFCESRGVPQYRTKQPETYHKSGLSTV